jgi:hypothetical protein
MKQDPMFALPRVWQAVSYAGMAIGLFLLFFLGARAFAQITDSAHVQGKPRQQTGIPGLGLTPVLPNGLIEVSTISQAPEPQLTSQDSSTGSGFSEDMTKREQAHLLHGVEKQAKDLEKNVPNR